MSNRTDFAKAAKMSGLKRNFELHVSFPADRRKAWERFRRASGAEWDVLRAIGPTDHCGGNEFADLHDVPGELAFLATRHFEEQGQAAKYLGVALDLVGGCPAVRMEFEEVLYVGTGAGDEPEFVTAEPFDSDAWSVPGIARLEHLPPYEAHFVFKPRTGNRLRYSTTMLKDCARVDAGIDIHQAALFGPSHRFVLTQFFRGADGVQAHLIERERALRKEMAARCPDVTVKLVFERINLCMMPAPEHSTLE